MPTITRYLTILGVIAALILGSLYGLATFFEPQQTEVTKQVYGVKVRKP